MHEMGIVVSFVKMAEEYAAKHNAAKVVKVVLQVGEISGVVPQYLQEFYPVVIEGTRLQGSELVIELLPASVFCTLCATTYNPTETDFKCPKCGGERSDVIDGRGLFVKEIVIMDSSPTHTDMEATHG